MYNNLDELESFQNLPKVNDISLMETAYEMYRNYPSAGQQYTKIMTEVN